MKKQLQFEKAQKLRKEVKDDTEKYEETITELKRKDQIRKIKFLIGLLLKPNTWNKTALQNENDSEEQHPCS